MKLNRLGRQTGWVLGAGFALGVLHLQVDAEAHMVSGVTVNSCSPHNQNGSNGGSVFTDCQGAPDSGSFWRLFTCPASTICAESLCNNKTHLVCGASTSFSKSKHGGSGGHKPKMDWYGCYPNGSCPE